MSDLEPDSECNPEPKMKKMTMKNLRIEALVVIIKLAWDVTLSPFTCL